ncbi:MAG: potassium transporter TrkG, partial [bacterium]|nr:potassium transporter TrkG [bacterium]
MLSARFDKMNPARVLALSFLVLIATGTMLLMLPWASKTTSPITFINALFTATSAVCVTGLTVVDTGMRYSTFGQSVILVLIQFGGLGLMTMATMMAVILGKQISLRDRVVIQEALNQFTMEGLVRLTKYVIFVTLTIEGIAASILFFRFLPVYG